MGSLSYLEPGEPVGVDGGSLTVSPRGWTVRHSALTHVAEAGVPLPMANRGNEGLRPFQRYARPSPGPAEEITADYGAGRK